MPLDMDALYRRVEEMVVDVSAAQSQERLQAARHYLRTADMVLLRRKLTEREHRTAKIPWLVATPINTLSSIFPVPPLPADYSVVASDGSSILPDRHSPVRYYVLSIGYAVLTYGSSSTATLQAQNEFCFDQEHLYFDPDGKRIPIEGTRLGIVMGVEEMGGLLDAAQQAIAPAVAIRDGSLILWNLQSEDPDFKQYYLDRFLKRLDAFCDTGTALASYISFPGSHDVINSLRLILCDTPPGGCKRCPQQSEDQQLCRFMGTLWDRQLFAGLLEPGQRSDIFQSQSAILTQYGRHVIQFFYLNVGGEIARIEAPQWVLQDPEMLDLVHSVVLDQCRRSSQYPPYPPALIEAHEKAVISTADRQAVQMMVERALALRGQLYTRSAKDFSKRSRGV